MTIARTIAPGLTGSRLPHPGLGDFRGEGQRGPVKWTPIVIPVLIVLGGLATVLVVPIDPRLKALIVAADAFAATAVGLILWRQRNGPR